ncbi:MAG: hypothetical protein IPM29_30490 [Planctomycetes bacterium]|nr:hypothetical protein [Planctomycetota bacterium]
MRMPPRAHVGLVAAVLLCAAAPRAQSCTAVPSDTPGFGAPSSVPFGNANPTDPVFSDTRYQVLIPRALLGAQPFTIRDLQVAPAGSRLRRFAELTVTLGHCPAGRLANPMNGNLVGPTRTAGTRDWLLPTAANAWTPLGLPFDFAFDPALGDLVVEFRVRGAGAPTGSGTAGLRTDQSLPYGWTTGGGYTGNLFQGGGIKLRLCTDTHGLLELGGGCPGSSGRAPVLGYSGSAQVGGPGLDVLLSDGPTAVSSLAVLAFSFGLRTAPLDLGLLGAVGCTTHVFGDVTLTTQTSGGSATLHVPVPMHPFTCLPIWNQWFVLDPAANAAGLTTSNPGRVLLGA